MPSDDAFRVTPEPLAKVTLQGSNRSGTRLFDSFGFQPDSEIPIKYSPVLNSANEEYNAFGPNPSHIEISARNSKPPGDPIEYTNIMFHKPKISAANCYKKSNSGNSR